MAELFQDWQSWVWGLGIIVAAGMTGLMVYYIFSGSCGIYSKPVLLT